MSCREETLRLVVISDFDGTATGVAGGQLVFSNFFKSLQRNPASKNYKSTPFLSPLELQQQFELNFDGHRGDPRLLSEEAECYFRLLLDSPSAKLCINTKNRSDYIIAMLKYLDFSDEQIARIDFRHSGAKNSDTAAFMASIQERIDENTAIRILDDSHSDFSAMMDAVNNDASLSEENIRGFHQAPGTYNATWQSLIRQDMSKIELIQFQTRAYLAWMRENASKHRFINRWSHFFHGGSGIKRAEDMLLKISQAQTFDDIKSELVQAVKDSGCAIHSYSRYLYSVLSSDETNVFTLSEEEFKAKKPDFIASLERSLPDNSLESSEMDCT